MLSFIESEFLIEYYRPGNMVNVQATAVRVTHIITGTIVTSSEHRGVHRNLKEAKKKIMEMLNAEQPSDDSMWGMWI